MQRIYLENVIKMGRVVRFEACTVLLLICPDTPLRHRLSDWIPPAAASVPSFDRTWPHLSCVTLATNQLKDWGLLKCLNNDRNKSTQRVQISDKEAQYTPVLSRFAIWRDSMVIQVTPKV